MRTGCWRVSGSPPQAAGFSLPLGGLEVPTGNWQIWRLVLNPGEVLQGYRIEEFLGQGGVGPIYKAVNQKDQAKVVLRVVEVNASEPEVRAVHKALIQRHVRLLSSLNIAGVLPFLECIQNDGVFYLVHRDSESTSLERLVQNRPVELAQFFSWAEQLMAILQELHALDPPLIVRELKPSTILVDASQSLQLVDFGIPGLYEGNSKLPAALQACKGYAPAELFGSAGVCDVRSDVYSLGAVCYRLLSGQIPPWSVELASGAAQLQPPQKFNPTVPLILGDVVLNMMALRRGSRYPSVREAAQALSQIKLLSLEGSPEDWEPLEPRSLSAVMAMTALQVVLLGAVGWLVYRKFGPLTLPSWGTPTPVATTAHPPTPAAPPESATPVPTPEISPTPLAEPRDYHPWLQHSDIQEFSVSETLCQNLYASLDTSLVYPLSRQQMTEGVIQELGDLLDQLQQDRSPLQSLAGSPPSELFQRARDILPPEVSSDLCRVAVMNGLIRASQDPYTNLLFPSQWQQIERQIELSSSLGGVGLQLELSAYRPIVLGIRPESAAQRAGFVPGDILLSIEGQSTARMALDVARSLIRGPVGSSVRMESRGRGVQTLLRTPDARGTTAMEVDESGVGYLWAPDLTTGCGEQLKLALEELDQKGARALILDLRNHGGESWEAALDFMGALLPQDSLVYSTRDRRGNRLEYRTSAEGRLDIPVICLVNRYTAGAAEVCALGLRDHKQAKLVGEPTFGRGSMQQVYELDPDAEAGLRLKLSVALCLGPRSEIVDRQGVQPDLSVPMSPDKVGKLQEDEQRLKAQQILSKSGS